VGIGHFAVGLALKKAEPRVNLGALIFAAYLSDFLFGLFVWFGLETYHVPGDLAAKHYLTFTFPYSHGLAASLFWSALAGSLFYAGIPASAPAIRKRAAVVVVIAVFSHFILDALVHVAGLPVLGYDSYKIGLGLWEHLELELLLEVAMVVIGLMVYLKSTKEKNQIGRFGMIALLSLLTPLMVVGQLTMTRVPSQNALIASWILTPLILASIAFWLDRQRIRVNVGEN
jgi:hypothetical protein